MDHDLELTWVFGLTHYGREDGSWRVLARESGLAHSRAIVDNDSNFFVSHFAKFSSQILLVFGLG